MKNNFFKIFSGLLLSSTFILAGSNSYTLTVDSSNVNENIGTAQINIRVTPQNKNTWNAGDKINITYGTKDSTTSSKATAGSDYTSISSKSLQIDIGSDGKALVYIPVNIINDSVPFEDDEDFVLYIKTYSATGGKSVGLASSGGLITIEDDDTSGLPSLSVNDIEVNEGDGVATFKVTLDNPSSDPVTFKYSTEASSASAGDDFISSGTEVTISAGSTEKTISISLVDDLLAELDEIFYLNITDPSSNAVIGDNRGVAVIKDDDIGKTISIKDGVVSETESDQEYSVDLILNEALSGDLTVIYHTEDNSAKKSSDYTEIISGTVVIPAGITIFPIKLNIIGDANTENTEDFYLKIDSINGSELPTLADDVSKITIFDNDGVGCSSYVGMMTINEYQNNPNYFDENHNKIKGNYIEIKYIDFLVKNFITDDWSITLYSNAGNQTLTWDKKDDACVDPRYEVFQMDNNVMGATGFVVIRDESGNEVDVFEITENNKYVPLCQNFVYDTDFPSSAQNKDLFREPDGTGDWFDHGNGANSGGSRCENKDGTTGLLFTEFDGIDIDETTPLTILGDQSVPIKTKEQNDIFGLKLLSINLETSQLKNSTVQIKVFLSDASGVKFPSNNPGIFADFLNSKIALKDGFAFPYSVRKARLYFEYCKSGESLSNWSTCYGTGASNKPDEQHRSHSRDMFSFRPHKLNLINEDNGDFYNLLKSGKDYKLAIKAVDKNDARANGYTVTTENYSDYLDSENIKYFNDGTEDINDELHGISKLDKSTPSYIIDGLSTTDGTDTGVAKEAVGISFSDVGHVKISVYDKTWAEVDFDDTPLDCTSDSHLFICGDVDVTFIPDHFKITDFKLKNNNGDKDRFTYVANDVENMSGRIEAKIIAVNAAGETTQNFKTGDKYYENEVTIMPAVEIEDETNEDGYFYPVAEVKGIETATKISFGESGIDSDGEKTLTFDDPNDYKLQFNFKRDMNRPSNPFDVSGKKIELIVSSDYTDADDSDTKNIKGKVAGSEVDSSKCDTSDDCEVKDAEDFVRFYYGIAKSSKDLYDNVSVNEEITPLISNVYCDLGYVDCNTKYDIDNTGGFTNLSGEGWWLSTGHKSSEGDGRIVVKVGTISEGSGSPTIDDDVGLIESGGVETDTTVKKGGGASLPMTANIVLEDDNSLTDFTDEWLIYNKDANIIPPVFYKVRFISPLSGWTGEGKTGNVVGENSSTKKGKRLFW